MKSKNRYIKFTGEGDHFTFSPEESEWIHLDHPVQDCTLCGATLDGDEATAGCFEMVKGPVTCPRCIEIIKWCKGEKVK